jgi:hypothetical protein
MIREAHERVTNKKLTTATKRIQCPLNSIQVPTYEWFYSRQQNELYQNEQGNFKAHPPIHGETSNKFKKLHTLKVLPQDAVQVTITVNKDCIQITVCKARPVLYNTHGKTSLNPQKWRDYYWSKTGGT